MILDDDDEDDNDEQTRNRPNAESIKRNEKDIAAATYNQIKRRPLCSLEIENLFVYNARYNNNQNLYFGNICVGL